MSTREEITARLRGLLEHAAPKAAPIGEFTEATAFTDMRFDSLAVLELVYDVEEEFHVAIADTELATLSTVGQLVDLIAQKTNEAGSG